MGHAQACYETAVQYAAQRVQFGRPLAASQIVQERLARMLSELTSIQTLVMAMTRKEEAGTLTGHQASLAKYTATRTARQVAANARDLLGGNGILLENRVARHFADVEAVHTYGDRDGAGPDHRQVDHGLLRLQLIRSCPHGPVRARPARDGP